jgi:cytochrome c oxidase subunit 1
MMLTGSVPDENQPRGGRRWAAGHLVALATASLLAVLFALATRAERLSPTPSLMDAATFRQLALLRDAFFALALALPSVTVLGHLLLPPALPGSPTARLDRLAVGAHLVGAAVLVAATATGSWATLELLAAAGALVGIGGILQALGFLGRLRTPQPRHAPTTMFARALALTALAELLVLPALVASFAILLTERLAHVELWRHAGADPLLFEHWLRRTLQPIAYVALVPCLGVVADELGARSRAVMRAAALLLLFGIIAGAARLFGDDGAASVAVGSFFSLALLVPLTVAVGNLLAHGRVGDGAAAWFAFAFVLCLVELGLTGLPLGMASLGPELAATAFAAAHQELLLAGLAFAVATALHRAWPSLTADARGQRLARTGCAIALFGVQLAVVAQLVAGRRGMPLTFEYPAPLRAFAIVTALGWLLAAAGAATIGANLVATARAARRR